LLASVRLAADHSVAREQAPLLRQELEMAATSFSFINGSPNCDHKAGGLFFNGPWWWEAAWVSA
jgi:hypothetical protein